MDLRKLKKLIDLVEESDIAELELQKREEGKIHQGWRESFRKNFKMSYDDFLIEFETFIDLKSKEQLKFLDQIN